MTATPLTDADKLLIARAGAVLKRYLHEHAGKAIEAEELARVVYCEIFQKQG